MDGCVPLTGAPWTLTPYAFETFFLKKVKQRKRRRKLSFPKLFDSLVFRILSTFFSIEKNRFSFHHSSRPKN
jgi:hypothetical protein